MNKKYAPKAPRLLKMCDDRGYACTYHAGRKINLYAKFGTPEAEEALRRLQIQVFTDPTLASVRPQQVSVDDLCAAYLLHTEEHDPGHFPSIKTAVKILLQHFAGQAVDTLDTRHFIHLQDMFVEYGVSRQYCNALMGYIRAMLKWGTIRKLVSTQVYGEAKLISALREGKTQAYENPEVEPVPDEVVRQTLPFMSPTIRTMVQIQRLTGMRPSEVCKMRVGDINQTRDTELWYYVPGSHKTEKHIGKKSIPLGKPEQELIAPYLIGKKPSEAVFSPKAAMAEWHAERRANRKTKISPSQLERERKRAKKPAKRQPGEFYASSSYRVAIINAIKKGNKTLPDEQKIPHWYPYQIRHAAGTDTEKTEGLDKAQALLGHTSADTTKRYAHGRLAITEDMARNRRNPFEDTSTKK